MAARKRQSLLHQCRRVLVVALELCDDAEHRENVGADIPI